MKNGTVSVLWYSADAELGDGVVKALGDAGCVVTQASSGPAVDDVIRSNPVSAVVADARGPSTSAFEILTQLRRQTSVPILLLTEPDSEFMGRCLELGADDCVAWPASARELVARVRVRSGHCGSHHTKPAEIALDIDALTREVSVDGRMVELTDREFELLAYLAASPGVTFTAEQLLGDVWGSRREWQSVTTVTEHIYRLRKKLETDPANPKLIITIRGRGYQFGG